MELQRKLGLWKMFTEEEDGDKASEKLRLEVVMARDHAAHGLSWKLQLEVALAEEMLQVDFEVNGLFQRWR